MAATLNNLAELYRAQRRYAQAEPFYRRLLSLQEKTLGPEHPKVAATLYNLAQSLENQATLLRKTARDAEAEEVETRAKAIRARLAQVNPKK